MKSSNWKNLGWLLVIALVIVLIVNFIRSLSRDEKEIPCTCLGVTYENPPSNDNFISTMQSWIGIEDKDIRLDDPVEVGGGRTQLRARISCNADEQCPVGFTNTDGQLIEGWVVNESDMTGQICKERMSSGGHTVTSCDFYEDIKKSLTCLPPEGYLIDRSFNARANVDAGCGVAQCAAADSPPNCCKYEEQTGLDSVRLEVGVINNYKDSAGQGDFNVIAPCREGYSSIHQTQSGTMYAKATCDEDRSHYYFNEADDCIQDCKESSSSSYTIIPPNDTAYSTGSPRNDSAISDLFNVKYRCNSGYNPIGYDVTGNVVGDARDMTSCTRPGDEFNENSVECSRDCIEPSLLYSRDLGVDREPRYKIDYRSRAYDLSRTGFNLQKRGDSAGGVECGEGYYKTREDIKVEACERDGGVYSLSGCEPECTDPSDADGQSIKKYYEFIQPSTLNDLSLIKDEFKLDLSCSRLATQKSNSLPIAETCEHDGAQYKLTGCYPICQATIVEEGADCIDMRVTYPSGTSPDVNAFRDLVLNLINDGAGDADAMTNEDITYLNKQTMTNSAGAKEDIIEFQITCQANTDCNIVRDVARVIQEGGLTAAARVEQMTDPTDPQVDQNCTGCCGNPSNWDPEIVPPHFLGVEQADVHNIWPGTVGEILSYDDGYCKLATTHDQCTQHMTESRATGPYFGRVGWRYPGLCVWVEG